MFIIQSNVSDVIRIQEISFILNLHTFHIGEDWVSLILSWTRGPLSTWMPRDLAVPTTSIPSFFLLLVSHLRVGRPDIEELFLPAVPLLRLLAPVLLPRAESNLQCLRKRIKGKVSAYILELENSNHENNVNAKLKNEFSHC